MLGNFSSGCHKIAEAKVGGTHDFFTLRYLLSKYVIVSCSAITIWTCFLRGAEEARLLCRRFLHWKKEYKRGSKWTRSTKTGSPTGIHVNFQPLNQSALTPETIFFTLHFLLKKICSEPETSSQRLLTQLMSLKDLSDLYVVGLSIFNQ